MSLVHTEAQAVQAEQMYNARYRPDQYQGPPQGFGYGLGIYLLLVLLAPARQVIWQVVQHQYATWL